MEVVIPDRWRGRFDNFTPDIQTRFAWLNQQLLATQSWLDGHANWLKRLAATDHPDKPGGLWVLGVRISFVLDADDPEHDEDSDNIICEMFDTLPLIPGDESRCYPLTDWRDDFCHETDHPMCRWKHSWLTRVLVDRGNPSLGWENILRIGQIWVDAFLAFDKTFPLDPSAPAAPASPAGIFACNSYEGDNWKKVLFAKRCSRPGPSSDELTCEDIARLDQMNSLMAGVETYLGTCGRWFHAAHRKRGEWNMEVGMEFVLDLCDPLFQAGGENTIYAKKHHVASCIVGKCSDLSRTTRTAWNWNEYEHWVEHPLAHQHHWWLFHDLYDHSSPRLGWQNILRIGSVRTYTRIHFSQSFPPLEGE